MAFSHNTYLPQLPFLLLSSDLRESEVFSITPFSSLTLEKGIVHTLSTALLGRDVCLSQEV